MGSKDVVIVGGGIVGLSAAYFLAQNGVKPLVIEQDTIGAHASGFAYGSFSPISGSGIPGPNYALAMEASRIYANFADRLPDESGMEFSYRIRPSIKLAFSTKEVTEALKLFKWQHSQRNHDVQWIDHDNLPEIEPRISPYAKGAIYMGGTIDIDPKNLVTALFTASQRAGTTIHHGKVEDVEISNERVVGIAVNGNVISCDFLVVANGPWAFEASKWFKVPIPVQPLKGQILRIQAPGPPIECSVNWQKHYATTKTDGLVWTGTTEEYAGFDESTSHEGRKSIISTFRKMLPTITDIKVVQQTACLRPVTPDNLPILGALPGVSNAVIATGGGRNGILLGPSMGRVVTDLILTGKTNTPIDHLGPGRFHDTHLNLDQHCDI